MNRGSAHGDAALRERRLRRDRETPPISARDSETDHVLAGRSVSLRNALARYFQRRVRDMNEVDDLVQEVFLRIVRRGSAGELEKLEGYVFKTAASVLTDRERRRKVRQTGRHVPFEPELHAGEAPGPERTLIGLQTLEAIGVALLELPERTRRVFVLRRVEGLSSPEIARRLGVSPSAVEKHMLKAVRHILARTRDDR
jgi:RNA polymerase sigma factor (sigma-70 family)